MNITAKEVFVKRIDLVMTSKLVSSNIQDRANLLGKICTVTPQAARKWLSGLSMPDYDNMKLIASRFDVSTSYLIGEINTKNFTKSDNGTLLKKNFRAGLIAIDLTETIFTGQLVAGDTAICHPCDATDINGGIYLLQNANNKFFRKLSFDINNNLVIQYEKNGILVEDVYKDKNLIELFLSSLIGRVESLIRVI